MKPKKSTEKEYARALKKIAKQAAMIVDAYADGHVIANPARMMEALERYAEVIEPFGAKAAAKMIADTTRSVEREMRVQSKKIAAGLRQYMASQSGAKARELMTEQVTLIKSLPIEAGLRAQSLAMDAVTGGKRPAEVAAMIEQTEQVTTSRAMLIARTESARAAAVVTEERARAVGATSYIWRTAGDSDVRESHAEMEGTVCSYDNPPIVDGEPLNPGEIFNCFVGETEIALDRGIRKLMRSGYNGQVVTLTAGSASFTSTPNHPILTGRGWIAAGLIKSGDYIVKQIDKSASVGVNKNKNMATFDDVFASFATRGKTEVSGFGFNFYGDIPDGNVDIVPIDLFLPDNIVPKILERIGDFSLSKSYSRIIDRIVRCSDFHVVKSFLSGFCDKLNSFMLANRAHAKIVSLTTISSLYATLTKNPRYYASCASVFSGQKKLAKAADIIRNNIRFWKYEFIARNTLVDNIDSDSLELLAKDIWIASDGSGGIFKHGAAEYEFLRVEYSVVTDFSGHVYTLETVNGWYSITPDRIISKNCRCYAEPILT